MSVGHEPVVIVVDASRETRALLRIFLAQQGIFAAGLSSFERCMRAFEAEPAHVEKVMLLSSFDTLGVGDDPRPLYERLQSIPNAKLIVLSRSAGATAYPFPFLRKPVSGDQLLDAIGRASGDAR